MSRGGGGHQGLGEHASQFDALEVPTPDEPVIVVDGHASQDAQVACFRNAAAHLAPGGHFVIEVGVPDLRRLPPGQTAVPFTVAPGRLGFDEYDVVDQGMISHHYWRTEDGRFDSMSVPFRYVWPSELDLMARLAGMSLRERWSGWTRSPFTAESGSHVSIWQTPV